MIDQGERRRLGFAATSVCLCCGLAKSTASLLDLIFVEHIWFMT